MSEDVETTIMRLAAEISKLPKAVPRVRVFTNENVPLTRTNRDTGEQEDALFWKIGGDIHVHPSRWEQFLGVMRDLGVEIR